MPGCAWLRLAWTKGCQCAVDAVVVMPRRATASPARTMPWWVLHAQPYTNRTPPESGNPIGLPAKRVQQQNLRKHRLLTHLSHRVSVTAHGLSLTTSLHFI